MQTLTVIPVGHDPRMPLVETCARTRADVRLLAAESFLTAVPAAKEGGFLPLLFVVAVDALGVGEDFIRTVRGIRALDSDVLKGCAAGVVLLGSTELDTKNAARELIFALDTAGCAFPEKPLVEATGSMKNLRVIMRTQALAAPTDALAFSVGGLLDRLLSFAPVRYANPRLLVLHASDRPTSNTLALGDLVLDALDARFSVKTLSLRNGTIEDCRGCPYVVCSHFANKGSCFYGGSISQEVIPAVQECDALLLLLPNYNDAVGANVTAFFNRLTGLHVSGGLTGQRLYAVVVSGYSGGDLVAKQAMGALCLNRSFLLPPHFCLLETANDPGEAVRLPGIRARAAAFAARLGRQLLQTPFTTDAAATESENARYYE